MSAVIPPLEEDCYQLCVSPRFPVVRHLLSPPLPPVSLHLMSHFDHALGYAGSCCFYPWIVSRIVRPDLGCQERRLGIKCVTVNIVMALPDCGLWFDVHVAVVVVCTSPPVRSKATGLDTTYNRTRCPHTAVSPIGLTVLQRLHPAGSSSGKRCAFEHTDTQNHDFFYHFL